MSLAQIALTILDGPFRDRVQAALYKAALQIVGESTATMSVAKATKRHILGCFILGGGNADPFIRAISSQIGEVADPSTILDTLIESTVSSVWDDVAGVTNAENQPP